MGRRRRVSSGGKVCHALSRANFRSRLFKKQLKRYLTPFPLTPFPPEFIGDIEDIKKVSDLLKELSTK